MIEEAGLAGLPLAALTSRAGVDPQSVGARMADSLAARRMSSGRATSWSRPPRLRG